MFHTLQAVPTWKPEQKTNRQVYSQWESMNGASNYGTSNTQMI